MTAIRALLTDRKRSQRGSVLSGVLIITAFLAIISGALMTELSTNFLVSRVLMHRVDNEATVSSAVSLALNQFQTTPLNQSGCPRLPSSFAVNGLTATVSFVNGYCVQRRILAVQPLASASVSVDGAHVTIGGRNDYLVGDSKGNVYDYTFGQVAPRGRWRLGGRVTGPPQAMLDPSNSGNLLYLIPIQQPNNVARADCGSVAQCVAVVVEGRPASSSVQCFMPANGQVTTQAAWAGSRFPDLVFFGDHSGALFAYEAIDPNANGNGEGNGEGNGNGGNCLQVASKQVPGGQIVAGPIVLQNGNRDEVYLVTSSGSSSQFLHYSYSQSNVFTLVDQRAISAGGAVGMVLNANTSQVAVTFATGAVAMVRIDSGYHPTVTRVIGLATPILDAPYWSSGNVIGVGGANGTLYLLDTNLGLLASYAAGSAIRTTPAIDAAGDWFFGADDGFVYELQQTTKTLTKKYGTLGGPIGSSVVVGPCPLMPSTVCIHLGLVSGNPSVPLDGRDAILKACITNSPPKCSGDNPSLWAQVEVRQAAPAPGTVHVNGWSYYST